MVGTLLKVSTVPPVVFMCRLLIHTKARVFVPGARVPEPRWFLCARTTGVRQRVVCVPESVGDIYCARTPDVRQRAARVPESVGGFYCARTPDVRQRVRADPMWVSMLS